MAHADQAALPAILAEVKPAVLPRAVLVSNHRSFSWITDKICGIIEGRTPAWWWWVVPSRTIGRQYRRGGESEKSGIVYYVSE